MLNERGNMGSTILVSFVTALITSLIVFFAAADFLDQDQQVQDETAQEVRELREDLNSISQEVQDQLNNMESDQQ